MTVLHLTSCPPALRGDLTKWLVEIAAGVYVGRVSARVRDRLWLKVVETSKGGRGVLVYSTNNEQRLDFRVHGESWEPIDFDGIKLMLRPSIKRISQKKSERPDQGKRHFSNAAKGRMAKRRINKAQQYPDTYAVIDIETTGLNPTTDKIIEIGAIKVSDGKIAEQFQMLISIDISVPAKIASLTGIDNNLLQNDGQPLKIAIESFVAFVGSLPLVAHNADFDKSFLNRALEQCCLPPIMSRTIDTLALTKRMHKGLVSYKLKELVVHFGLNSVESFSNEIGLHRSLGDCYITHQLYQKLLFCAKV